MAEDFHLIDSGEQQQQEEQARLRPKWETRKLDGTRKITRFKRVRKLMLDEEGDAMVDEQGRKMYERSSFEPYEVDEPAGWMVFFPNGHSIYVHTEQEMVRLGFAGRAPLVDEYGQETVVQEALSLEQQVMANTRKRSRRASGGG